MKVVYNPTTDIIRIVFRDVPVEDFNEEQPGMKVDYDMEDQIIAIEIRQASRRIDDPRSLQHEIVESP